MKIIHVLLAIGAVFTLSVVLISCGKPASKEASNSFAANLPLNDREKEQLEYEKLYLDSIFSLTAETFGNPEGFNEFGEIYIDYEKEFRFVIAVAKEDDRVTSIIKKIKGIIPESLLSVQRVEYSKSELVAVQNDILQKMSEGYKGLSSTSIDISSLMLHAPKACFKLGRMVLGQ